MQHNTNSRGIGQIDFSSGASVSYGGPSNTNNYLLLCAIPIIISVFGSLLLVARRTWLGRCCLRRKLVPAPRTDTVYDTATLDARLTVALMGVDYWGAVAVYVLCVCVFAKLVYAQFVNNGYAPSVAISYVRSLRAFSVR